MPHSKPIAKTDPALRSIMDASPVGIVVFDHDANVVYANALAEQLFGKPVNALIGNRCGDFLACQHRHSDPRGCGHTGQCPRCPFYQAIQAVLSGTADPDHLQGEALVHREAGRIPIWFKFKAGGIVLDGLQSVVMALDDITKSKQGEAALQESESRFRLMFMNAPMPYQSLDEQGNFIEVNQTFLDVLGYTRQDLIGKNFADILHPDGVDHFKHNFPRFKAVGEILGVEFEMVKKDGTTILVFFNGRIQRDAQGRFERTHCIFQDITDRRRAENQLREKTVLLQNITDHMLDMVAITDLGGVFTYAGPSHRILGFEPAQFLGTSVFDYVHPDDAKYIANEFKDFITNPTPATTRTVEYRQRCADGSYLWLETKGKILFDDNGSPCSLFFSSRDVTDRKEAIEALRESEERFKTIIENLPGGVFTHDFDGRLLIVNQAASKNTGYSAKELLSLNVEDIDAGGFTHEDRGKLWHSLNMGDALTIESRHTRRDGSKYPVEIHLNAISLDRHPAILAIAFDITERKQAEHALRDSEEKYRELFESAPVGIYKSNSKGRYLSVNPEYAFIAGYNSPEEMVARITDIASEIWVRPEERKNYETALQQNGQVKNYEAELKRPDGRPYWVSMSAKAHGEQDGGFVYEGFLTDITDHKQAEEALRAGEERFYKAFMSSPAPMVVSEIDTGRFIDVNERWVALTGYAREEQIGRTSHELGLWADPADRQRIVDALMAQQSSKDVPIVFKHKSGDDLYVRWSAEIISLADKRVMLSLFFDETGSRQAAMEKEKLQAQLQQAQKMESIGRLAGGVAHDYNNMLSVIAGYTEMALEKIRPDDPLHDDLTEVFKAAQRSTDITRQLLAFARKQTIDPRVIDLNDIVESLLRMLRRLIGEDIDLNWHPGKQLWPVKMDPAQVDQILVNLCVNARDAIGGVGEVAIETGNITVGDDYGPSQIDWFPGDYVMLAVSDDGRGMDRQTLDNIFEPFFTTKGTSEGTGLGLSTVYGIVKQNHGFVNVYSEPGKGTTFRIYLPKCNRAATQPPLMDKTQPPHGRGETVLLVEDEPAIMRMGEMMLKRLGYQVLAAGTPGRAIQMAAEHKGRIDLLITDVVMPEMNGRQLSEQLDQLIPGVRTLFMSGYTANVIAHRGVLDEGMHFIQKPFSAGDLGMKVRSVLDDI